MVIILTITLLQTLLRRYFLKFLKETGCCTIKKVKSIQVIYPFIAKMFEYSD